MERQARTGGGLPNRGGDVELASMAPPVVLPPSSKSPASKYLKADGDDPERDAGREARLDARRETFRSVASVDVAESRTRRSRRAPVVARRRPRRASSGSPSLAPRPAFQLRPRGREAALAQKNARETP